MPYIDPKRRLYLTLWGGINDQESALTPGELNFQITGLIKSYMNRQPLNYQSINDIIGALEGAKLEFYRRIAAPYENDKIEENGDVY